MGHGVVNPYQTAIASVGKILEVYDRKKQFPVYGFGGRLRDGTVSHFFPLTGSYEVPFVNGVSGIIEAYQ